MSEVISIGEFEFHRKPSFRMGRDECAHRHIDLDDKGQIVTCRDCKKQIDPYWVLTEFSEVLNQKAKLLTSARKEFEEQQAKGVTLKAAQKVEKAWRSHRMVPACPHCLHAITPTDGFGGTMLNKDDPEGARKHLIATNKTLKIWTDDTRKV